MPRLSRRLLRQADGRGVYLYGSYAAAPAGYRSPERPSGTYDRRWNPLRAEWVLVAASRQDRTFLPERANCPLCPSTPSWSSEVPAGAFDLAVFENRFPSMPEGNGVCEVVVYTEKHEATLGSLTEGQMSALVEAWTDRYRQLARRPDVSYVYIFENRGEAVGVTLHHPHGQIYGYPFIPPVAETELRAGRDHARRGGGCLQCHLV
ncbi:MAG: galactose-1-phosphate uridylyltransferase, partial [Candidatus Dormibacteraeota bacterium]|nr:galactose-1-phosphate uridylyltransferase [Candidatus Dormibacteraeota bacterium]